MRYRDAVTALAAGRQAPAKPHVLHWDVETRGVLDLRRVGAWKYAADPRTEVICVSFAADNSPVQLWLPDEPVPSEFLEAARDPSWLLVAHGAQFEIAIERLILFRRYDWPKIPIARHRCTMAMSLAHALPPSLEHVAEALELVHQKDQVGHRLMLMMARPRRPRKAKGEDPHGCYWFNDQDRLERLYEYCKQDVEVERELYSRLRPLSPEEQQLWRLDLRINSRGFAVDRAFAEAARKIAAAARPEIDAELEELTEDAVTSIGQVARLLPWLQRRGYAGRSLKRDAIELQLEKDDLPSFVRRVLELRLAGAQGAAKKIDRLLDQCGSDGRIRGSFRFHGAATGRWSGDGVQPQNLKHPEVDDLDAAIAAIRTGNYEHVKKRYAKPLAIVGDVSRAMICAAPDHVLVGADFSAVESRVLAWIAGEEWKLNAYRRFDRTADPRDEPYCVTACKIFQMPAGSFDANSPERETGKTCDLAFGYQGGLGAWRKFEPDQFSDEEVQQFKLDWRAAHPAIKRFWYAIDRAAWEAVRNRGQIIECGAIELACEGAFLFLTLPSGRQLAYPFPKIKVEDARHQSVVFKDNAAGQWRDCRHGQGAYGGLWTENIVSAISRDLLADAMLRLERAGYRIVLHVHDELVAEMPKGTGSLDEFTELMIETPAWAGRLPIAAKAWTGPHFQ